ncbi:hypothetical protein BD410DRAFT_821184 [Rickenella mellea]|uniref:Mediator of RNA polymerase II transcription subunit 12 n=1 Tax=Rickenella mellea TaxID=50990 RepID=A0A4Y7Q609_9AGAM|nr:hypothetical protein BD410DRAFT_821184 [Rickenella mellea]
MANEDANDVPEIYESVPPTWLPKTSTTADVGYLGFYPPHPYQEEELLSDTTARNGIAIKPAVLAETYTAQMPVIKALNEDNYPPELEDFMNQVFQRRIENLPKIPPSTFKIPSRVTLNDAKRNAWFADLANPDVPLYKLGKSIPHGARGHDLLDLLQSNNVAIPRAVWFLRVFGSNETAGLRNKPNYNPTQYSVDWATIVTGYLKKQLADIALPSHPRAGLNIKQTFKGVLSDADTRERWIQRFSYSLDLLRTFYSEGMVDHCTFLSWLVQQMVSCNLAQAGFIARLTDDYLDGLVGRRALTRPLIDCCLSKLTEISSSSSKEHLVYLQERLNNLLRRIFLASPHAFVSPRMWTMHRELLRNIFVENILDNIPNPTSTAPHIEQSILNIKQTMAGNFGDIESRNEALLFRNLPYRGEGRLRSAVYDVHLLNSISASTDVEKVVFFDAYAEGGSDTFAQKLDGLLSWCVTPLQYGDHRPYAAITLLRLWREKAEERASRRDFTSPNEILQDQLFDWLDSSDLAAEEDNLIFVSLLFGELVEKELFSYPKYIQRLIARGEPGLLFSEDPGSRHRYFLRSIPLHSSTPALINQRKVILYGVRAREIPEDRTEKEIRKELRAVFPELFGGEQQTKIMSSSDLRSSLPVLQNALRYEKFRTIRQWLLPSLRKHLCRNAADSADQSNGTAQIYCVAVEVLESIKFYRSILDISLGLLGHTSTNALLIPILETLRRHVDIWACMNVVSTITHALHSTHQSWKSRGVQSRALLSLLTELDGGRHLDDASRQQITSDISHYAQALCPTDDHSEAVPPVLPEILLLAQDPNDDAASMLANALWYKYRASNNWAWTVWDNAIASLRQVPLMMSTQSDRRICALRYAKFLQHVDEHLAGGLDNHALRWFLGSGLNEIAALTAEAWDVVTVVFLYLTVNGALTTTTLLHGVVYPGWRYGSTVPSNQQYHAVGVFVNAANTLCESLLLKEDGNHDGIPPSDLLDLQRIRTRRQDVYREPHFSLLVNNLPTLVSLETNSYVDPESCLAARALRQAISRCSEFRLCAYRNLPAVRSAFEKPLESEAIARAMHEPLLSALRQILSDADPDTSSPRTSTQNETHVNASFLSTWNLAASTITIQFELKQMGEGLVHESTRQKSDADLNKYTEELFHHNMTADEVDFLADMARGIGTAVAGKFLNNGLRRIAEILDECASSDSPALTSMVRRAGEYLRLLSSIVKPFRDEPSTLPSLEATVQDALILAMAAKFEILETLLHGVLNGNSGSTVESLTGITIFLSRLLQFNLGFAGVWTPKTLELIDHLLNMVFRLALLHGGGITTDPVALPLFLDTAFYIFDELPVDSKPPNSDLFQRCPKVELSDLPATTPPPYGDMARSLLKFSSDDRFVSGLVYASFDASGEIQYGQPVRNQPWEWIENLGEPANAGVNEQQRDKNEVENVNVQHIVRNNASLSLELFNTRLTGEHITHGNDKITGPLRMFEDNLTTESVFERGWRESRQDFGGDRFPTRREDEEEDMGSQVQGRRSDKRTTAYHASPAGSTHSRSSAAGSNSASSRRQSPGITKYGIPPNGIVQAHCLSSQF